MIIYSLMEEEAIFVLLIFQLHLSSQNATMTKLKGPNRGKKQDNAQVGLLHKIHEIR